MTVHHKSPVAANVSSSADSPAGDRRYRGLIFSLLILIVGNLAFAGTLRAEEPYLKFLDGLRERQYYDYAMKYLETLTERENVPQDVKELIPYERAKTLLASSNVVRNSEAQSEQLDQAQAYLEQFLKDSPDHELAARANTDLANIMLGKAKVLIWKSRSPSNKENRKKFQQDARQLIQQAREIFQTAHDAYKKEYESYGVYIPEDEKEKRAKRKEVEGLYMQAQLDLANCTYQEAQTYDEGSEKFNELLQQASLEFEDLHSKYRSQYAGLFARTMQGKCFEEQGDIRKALGIYDEILGHPGQSEGFKRLKNQVLHFRLISLNDESRKDYQLVIMEADEWLKANRAYARSTTGLGIRWEMAQAQENLALQRTTPEGDRTRLLRQALENAREINRFAGPYKDVSNSMIQRVLVALDREPGDPKDFDSAYGTANNLLEQVGKLREELKAAEKAGDDEKVKKLQAELDAQLSETERIYRLALSLATESTDVSEINAARYRLAYMYYLQRKSYETAVIGDYVAARAKETDPTMALDGAYLAMAGLMQAINDAPEEQRNSLLDLMVETCENIATNWPNSDRATDARMEMGRIYRMFDQPLKAAKWYGEVPDTVPQYAIAQMEAGQAYWNAYLKEIVKEEQEASPDELKKWQDQAAKHLQTGITERQKGLPENRETPAELVRAKVSLSQIEIMRGNDEKAVEMLTNKPHAVVDALTVADGEQRPKEESNIKSVTFSSFAYQQLLRAYIGSRQLEKAEEARLALEKIAGQSGGEALTAVYVELGQELQKELERLRKQGDTERMQEVRAGFEAFLKQLFNRKSGQTYGSLIWIAETYFGLAEGTEENPRKAKEYYQSAAKTYEEIIKRAENNPDFIDANRLTGVRLRLVNCKRQEGDYEAAEENAKLVLKKNPKALDAQIAAAGLFQDWGNAEGDPEKFLIAVRGKTYEDGTALWGWANLGKRLIMIIDGGQAPPDYHERNREVQYHLAQSRMQYAEHSSDPDESDNQLKRAKADIVTYARFSPDLYDTDWWSRFDKLYQNVQTNLGEAVVPLQKPDVQLAAADGQESNYDSGPDTETKTVAEVEEAGGKNEAKEEKVSSLGTYITMGFVVLVSIGIIGYTLMNSNKRPARRSTAEMVSTMPKDDAKKPSPRSAGKKATKRPASGTAGKEGTKSTSSSGEKKRTRPRSPEEAQARKKKVRRKPPTAE